MTRHEAVGSKRAATGAAILFFSSLVGLGCELPPGQFIIVQNQVPIGGVCAIPATVSNAYLDKGTLDVRLVLDGADLGYAVFPVMQNNLPPPTAQGADLNRIKVSGFDVDVSLADPTNPLQPMFDQLEGTKPHLLHYNILSSGSISSGGGNTASLVNAVPAALAREIRGWDMLKDKAYAEIFTTIRVRGETDGGQSVKSDAFRYPIQVCDGCLIQSRNICPSPVEPTAFGHPCNIAQDAPIDCCILGQGLVCPPTVAAQ